MNIIGMYVFNVYLQSFTKSKRVTHKSISYATHASARRLRRLRRLGRPITEKLFEHLFIKSKSIILVFSILLQSPNLPTSVWEMGDRS